MNTTIKDVGREVLPDEDTIYRINTFGADFTVDGLVSRFDRGDIYRPDFQRNFVWSQAQASKFIESILLGLPIPSIFLYREEESQKHLIVDGLQRLTTLLAFTRGVFPYSRKNFRLVNVQKRYSGRTIYDLEDDDKRRFYDAVIHAMIIQQNLPQGNKNSVFHIFERLNSNGTPLEPQEIRAAVFHGPLQEFLQNLNEFSEWRVIFGPPHKRSKDEELILRFFAFLYMRNEYVSPMKLFLNNFMEKNRSMEFFNSSEARHIFLETMTKIYRALGRRAFRIQRSLNAAVFDSFAVSVALNENLSDQEISSAYNRLMGDEVYLKLVSKATANEKNVERRFEVALQAIHDSTIY